MGKIANRQSLVFRERDQLLALTDHSAILRGTNVARMNAIAIAQFESQRNERSVSWGEIWLPTNASDSNRGDDSR